MNRDEESRENSADEGPNVLEEQLSSKGFCPLNLDQYEFSLQNDTELGYRPRLDNIAGPLPFVFLAHNQARVIRIMEELGDKCIYKGNRPKNSFDIHITNQAGGSLYEINDPCFKVLTDKTIQGLLNKEQPSPLKRILSLPPINQVSLVDGTIVPQPEAQNILPEQCNIAFDGNFENGNLDLAFRTTEGQYNLLTRPDTNSKGHTQWFFFKVRSTVKQTVQLNLINMVKPKSLFGRGAYPYIGYKDSAGKFVWGQLPDTCRLSYTRTNLKYDISEGPKKRIYMTLSFSLELESGRERWIAYSIPYTYSDLLRYIENLSEKSQGISPSSSITPRNSIRPMALSSKSESPTKKSDLVCKKGNANKLCLKKLESRYLKVEKLCKGESLVDVPLITITDFAAEEGDPCPIESRALVYIVSRAHPSESVASWALEGFINKLLDDSHSSKAMRKLLVFKIVPMLNPDGVLVGNFRTNLSGDDLNRRFDTPSQFFHPSVNYSKPRFMHSSN
jgi:hypothetical protein